MKYIYSLLLVIMLFVVGSAAAKNFDANSFFIPSSPSDFVDTDKRLADIKLSPEKDLGNFDYDATITRYVDCSKQVLIKTVCTVKTNPHGLQEI